MKQQNESNGFFDEHIEEKARMNEGPTNPHNFTMVYGKATQTSGYLRDKVIEMFYPELGKTTLSPWQAEEGVILANDVAGDLVILMVQQQMTSIEDFLKDTVYHILKYADHRNCTISSFETKVICIAVRGTCQEGSKEALMHWTSGLQDMEEGTMSTIELKILQLENVPD